MKALMRAALLAALLVPAVALAQSAFDGTWKIDMGKANLPKKPDVFVLQNGMYDCKTCAPPISVKADGTDQPVKGYPYFDTLAVKVVDDHTVESTGKKAGKVVMTSTTSVTPDGQTAQVEFSDSSATNAAPMTGKATMTRVAKGVAGGHALSGSWRTISYAGVSDNALTITFREDAGNLSMSTPMGQSYTAKVDGQEAPYRGDPGITTVTVKRQGKHGMVETDLRDGKVVGVATMAVSPDGKSMNIAIDDKLHGTTSSFVAMKQ
ncbi:hypothetical protein [Dyella subtropica]|uniref:hypothetical protein n=1 Tax=Dyella subtropica TaxID=2992127 RepID=UPI00225913DE|nr:hypothetical protein [Dyella subtropica]